MAQVPFLFYLVSGFSQSMNKAEANPFPGAVFPSVLEEMAPYGGGGKTGVQDSKFLGYVWLPYAEQGFPSLWFRMARQFELPYGKYLVFPTNELRGWAPFHYGRWYFDKLLPKLGWVPDYDWGPSLVNWRTGEWIFNGGLLGSWLSLNVGYCQALTSYFILGIGILIITMHIAYYSSLPQSSRNLLIQTRLSKNRDL